MQSAKEGAGDAKGIPGDVGEIRELGSLKVKTTEQLRIWNGYAGVCSRAANWQRLFYKKLRAHPSGHLWLVIVYLG